MSYTFVGKDGKFSGSFVLSDTSNKFIFGEYHYSTVNKQLEVKTNYVRLFNSSDELRISFTEKVSYSEIQIQQIIEQLKVAHGSILPIVQLESF